jgi:hypothetical protein
MHITGTGALSFLDCTLTMPGVAVVVESDPTQVGQDVQEFDANMRSMSGQLIDETDCNVFADLQLLAGTDHELPSPGHTRLVRRPDGTFDVDSHFDVRNTITFIGKNALAGFGGSTTTTVHMGTPQTQGEAAKEVPLRVTDFDSATGNLSLSYGAACWSDDHDVYFGPLDQVAGHGWSGQACSIGNSGTYDVFNPGSDSYFFVIVGHKDADEGSYGKTSAGVERPPYEASACQREQILSKACQ